MDNLKNLADVIFPVKAFHDSGGLGIDRLYKVYRYRPHLAQVDLDTVAEVPVNCWRRSQQGEQPAAVAAIRAVVPEAGQQQPAGGEGEVQLPQREEEPAEPAAVQPGDQPAGQQGTARGSRVPMSPLPLVLTPRLGRGGPEGWSKEWAEEMPLPNSFEECVLLVRNSYASRVMEGWLQLELDHCEMEVSGDFMPEAPNWPRVAVPGRPGLWTRFLPPAPGDMTGGVLAVVDHLQREPQARAQASPVAPSCSSGLLFPQHAWQAVAAGELELHQALKDMQRVDRFCRVQGQLEGAPSVAAVPLG
jgi:hypothetical protein